MEKLLEIYVKVLGRKVKNFFKREWEYVIDSVM